MGEKTEIEISQELFERLQRLAIPLVDNMDSLLKRIVDEYEELRKRKTPPGAPAKRNGKAPGRYVTSRGVSLPFGRLRAVYRRRGASGAREFEAAITAKGIEFDGQTFDDPSPAGIHAKKLAGAKGSAASTNGWEFWEYFREDSQRWVSLDSIRRKLASKLTLADLGLDS